MSRRDAGVQVLAPPRLVISGQSSGTARYHHATCHTPLSQQRGMRYDLQEKRKKGGKGEEQRREKREGRQERSGGSKIRIDFR